MHHPSIARAGAAALALTLAAGAAAQSKVAPPPPPAPKEVRAEETDGERAVGRWGLAFFGVTSLDFGPSNPVSVYTVGVRHWMKTAPGNLTWGIDAGLGLVLQNSTEKAYVLGPVEYKATAYGISLHAGLPVTLARTRHANFLFLPEANLLYAKGSNDQPGPGKTDWKGYGVDLGARAGFELFFGFLGTPQLALEATAGFGAHFTSTTGTRAGVETGQSSWTFGTDRPLGFIVGNIAAIYYF